MTNSKMTKSIFGFVALFAAASLAQAKEVPPANRISHEVASKAAISAFPGKIKGEELEFEGGKWIYSFDLTSTKDAKIHEVHVDAITGKVLDMHTETASDEQKEKQDEADEHDAD